PAGRSKAPGTEVAKQAPGAGVGGDPGQYSGRKVLADRDATLEQPRHLNEAGTEDDGRGQKEGEPRCFLVAQPRQQAAADGDARPRDAWQEGKRLARADDRRGKKADALGASETRLLLTARLAGRWRAARPPT